MNAKKIVNLTKFLLAGALVLGMTACSSDDDITKGGTDSKVNTYMTVSLTGNSLQRTTNPGTGEPGDDQKNENKISTLRIYLVNTSSNLVTTIKDFAATDLSGTDTKTTQAFQVPIGSYKVYAVVNPSDKFTVTASTTTNTQLKTLLYSSASQADFANTTNGFLMTNAVNYQGDETEIPTVAVTTANSNANPAKPSLPIHLDRMAVKIRVDKDATKSFSELNNNGLTTTPQVIYYDGTGKHTKPLTIKLVNYAPINSFQKAYLYQNWSGTTNTFAQELVSPNYSSSYSYLTTGAADYVNKKSDFATKKLNVANTIAGYDELQVNTSTLSWTTIDPASATASEPIYTLENNAWETNNTNDKNIYTKDDQQVTGVMFQAQAYTDVSGTATPTTFYSYNGKYYLTLDDIQKEYPNVFRKYFDATETDASKVIKEIYDGTKSSEDNQKAQLDTAKATSLTPNDIRVRYGVKVFESGKMYYPYYIKDANYTETQGSTPLKNYYAIMRNTIYSLKVKNLMRIGEDIPFGWEPDNQVDPIDQNEAYMSIELVINPWVLNTYDVDLK